MSLALSVLSDLPDSFVWALGGGTALAIHLNHRISFDVDIFFEHPKALKEIMKNPKTKQITSNWHFPGNYLKLICEEGEIDFILASDVTEQPHIWYDFKKNFHLFDADNSLKNKIENSETENNNKKDKTDRNGKNYKSSNRGIYSIRVETPQEIIGKKIKYRGSKFTIRDTFDLASVLKIYPNLFENYLDLFDFKNIFEGLLQRVKFLKINEVFFKDAIIKLNGNNWNENEMFDLIIRHIEKAL